MVTLALYNLKGGVGKTAAAVNLAYLAARDGIPTLLWDLDPQGSATWCLGEEPASLGKQRKLLKGRTDLLDRVRETSFEHLSLLPADFENRTLDLALPASRWSRRTSSTWRTTSPCRSFPPRCPCKAWSCCAATSRRTAWIPTV